MESPQEVMRELEKSILKPDYTFEHMRDLVNETITHIFHLKMSINSVSNLPAIIFVTESKKVLIYCLMIDEEMQEDGDLADIDAVKRGHINEHRFKYMLLNKELQFEGFLTAEKLPFVNYDAIKEYRDYVNNKLKEEQEKYQKELEYKRYLELKNKYEEGINND